jgi:mediator of RNA polymerase II transcription subunit 6
MTSWIDDLTHVSWRDNFFLANFPLTQDTVLDYFSGSPFYDASCNNEQVRMQGLDPAVLNNMVGTEYIVTNQQEPSFFVIEKVYRYDKETTETLQVFYILEGTVYQCPSLRSLLLSRLSESFFHLSCSFQSLQQASLFSKIPASRQLEQGEKQGNLESKSLQQETPSIETSIVDRILSFLSTSE